MKSSWWVQFLFTDRKWVVTVFFSVPIFALNLELILPGAGDTLLTWLQLTPPGETSLWHAAITGITGNFVHWSAAHLFWDLGIFMGLGYLYERHGSKSFAAAVGVSAVITGGGVMLFQPETTFYRGLSGLNHGLLVYGIVRDIKVGLPSGYLLAAPIAFKVLYELATGDLLSPGGAFFEQQFAYVSHFFGATGGLIVGCFSGTRRTSDKMNHHSSDTMS